MLVVSRGEGADNLQSNIIHGYLVQELNEIIPCNLLSSQAGYKRFSRIAQWWFTGFPAVIQQDSSVVVHWVSGCNSAG